MNPDLYREMAETQQRHWWFRARREILERVIARLALPHPASDDAALPARLVNGILYRAFSLEKYIVPVRLLPCGTSVLAILARDDSNEP